MPAPVKGHEALEPEARDFYRRVLRLLMSGGVPHLIGGAYALAHHTGIERDTKDFDVFLRRADYDRAMEVLRRDGCSTELTFPHWLGKAVCGDNFVDVIFSSGNGVAVVDDEWFDHASSGIVFDMAVKLCPAEEMIWSKAYIMERERFDGADIIHLVRARGETLDWPRLVRRFGRHWRVLFSHLVMFSFVYPAERAQVPAWVLDECLERLRSEASRAPPPDRTCNGTLISREQYLVDLEVWGYKDGRLCVPAVMSDEDVERWTAAISEES
jgi:hypothetical protein